MTDSPNNQNETNSPVPNPQSDFTSLALGLNFGQMPDISDVQLPRARLAQGLTPEVLDGTVQAGQWLLPGGTTAHSLSGKIVGVRKTRILWDRSGPSVAVACRSDDGVTGEGDPGGSCDECPCAEWVEKQPPSCTLSYEYLLIQESGSPIIVTMSTRSAGSVIGQLNLVLRTKGSVKVKIGSQLIVRGSRRYYIPSVLYEW